ncbi:hypothetical protein OA416_00295 [Paracoccaceae bacterium]|nr:hypothetical protein [Paracoccaceae bacterium]
MSKKNVIEVINKQINSNTPIRFKNFFLNLLERLASLKDIPDIMMKLAPMHWASNRGTPWVIFFWSINLK